MSLAFYRKYRPVTFNDLIGQEMTVKILKEAIKQNRIAHAYLLAGPRGTGKTTIARLIAKIANCINRKESEPCNNCFSCKAINAGTALDIIEIDAASNRGIDEIRGLKENVRSAPSSFKYKVFIIDEAHALTKDAANALLKTLEEPPQYVIIILATTEIEKIPATIISRTQVFQLKYVPLHKIFQKLKSIVEGEKIKISDEALELIAQAGEGSFRDSESLLDQMFNLTGPEITVEEIEKILGKIGFSKISEFAEKILQCNLEAALKILSTINEQGHNLSQLTKDLIHYFRKTAVIKYNPAMKTYFEKDLIKEHLEIISEHSKIFQPIHLQLLKSLITAYSQMRYSPFPIIPLEIALIENMKNLQLTTR